jgi:AraC-like DNA-binding protein
MKEIIKELIIAGHSLKDIQDKCSISFRSLKTLLTQYGYNNCDYNLVMQDLHNGLTYPEISAKYVLVKTSISKCLTDNMTLEDFNRLVSQYPSLSKATDSLLLPANLLTKLSRTLGYKKHNIDINTAKSLYETGDFNKKELAKQLGCTESQLATVFKNEGITNSLLDSIEQYYVSNYTDCEICKELNITQDRLDFLYKKHAIKQKKKIKETIDIEEFTDLYVNKRYSYIRLAEYYGCSLIVIYSLVKKINKNRPLKTYIFNKEELTKLYITDNLTQEEIANLHGCCQNTVDRALKEFNVIKTNCYSSRESILEKSIRKLLEEHNIYFEQNTRNIIKPRELDFYLPEHNIAIEICGLYWHSTKVNKDKLHIFNKFKECETLGIRLITIFEDELLYKQDIVFNRLKSILKLSPAKIYARHCTVKTIDSRTGIDFLNKTHIQGSGKNSVYIGAYSSNTLVAVMAFSKPSISKGIAKAQWELNRFSSVNNIPGVASKLFKFFERQFNPTSIISYSDLRWNTGDLYLKLGFKHTHNSKPNYWYVVNQERKHRFAFTKQRLLELFSGEDAELTEQQIAEKHNLYRVYDCGNSAYLWSAQSNAI